MIRSSDHNPNIFLGMPGYGSVTPSAARGFWRSTAYPNTVHFQYNEGSLLAQNFNALWCVALNLLQSGKPVDYFAMQHADVEPEDFWLDKMLETLKANDLDVLSAAIPIKDPHGLTSTALAKPGDTWNPLCRLTINELHRLPETFTAEDVGHPLLMNTGLWVCRFDPAWVKKVHFEINDRIVFDTRKQLYVAQVEPEDWYFSRLCNELQLRIGITRCVSLGHRGQIQFSNDHPWGDEFDSTYTDHSVIPEELEQEPIQTGQTALEV